MPLLRESTVGETQTTSSGIQTLVSDSISNDDNASVKRAFVSSLTTFINMYI